MPRKSAVIPIYMAHVVAGLEGIAAGEIRDRLQGVAILDTVQRFDERTGLVVFRWSGTPAALLQLRTVEDVFAQIGESNAIPANRAGLAAIRSLLTAAANLESAAGAAMALRKGRKGAPTFRVIARKSGDHAFRRVDVQRAVEVAVSTRMPRWRLVEDDAQIEIWVNLIGSRFYAGARLSDIAMRGRTYRAANLPAALKPTIAAAMVRLSEPNDDDVFLDPMCGSGTIPIERALAGRYRLILAGDADAEAVAVTRENVGPRYKPIEIRQWDARSLPLDTNSVSALVTNLPFGKQIGTHSGNRALYPALLREWTRVLQPGGRMVVLTSERALWRRTMGDGTVQPLREVPVLVRGVPATIFVCTLPG